MGSPYSGGAACWLGDSVPVLSGVGGIFRMRELHIAFSLLFVLFASGVSSFYPGFDKSAIPDFGPAPVNAEVTGRSSVVAPNAVWPYLNDHHQYPPYRPSYNPGGYGYNRQFSHGRRYGYGGRYGGYGGYGGRYGGYGGRYGGYPGYYRPPYYGNYYPQSQALPNYINFANQLSLAHNDPKGPYMGTHYKRAGRKRRSIARGYGGYGGYYGHRHGGRYHYHNYYNPYYYGYGRRYGQYRPFSYNYQNANGLDDPMLTASFPSRHYGYTMQKLPNLRMANPFGYNSPGLALSAHHQYSRLGYSNFMSEMGRDGPPGRFGFPSIDDPTPPVATNPTPPVCPNPPCGDPVAS